MTCPTSYATTTNNSLAKDLTIFTGLVVQGVLQIDVLEDAANKLVTKWPILGGNLIIKTSPYSFVTGSACDFQARKVDEYVSKYLPLHFEFGQSSLPEYRTTAADELFHFSSMRPFNILPRNLLTIRVTILKDATLFGFRVPHHFCDGQSLFDIVEAYRRLVTGQDIQPLVPPPDVSIPLSTLVPISGCSMPANLLKSHVPFLQAKERLALGFPSWMRYVGTAMMKILAGKLGLKERAGEKWIHLPRGLVERLKFECQKELDQKVDGSVAEVSKLDVISAWLLKAAFYSHPEDKEPVNLMYNFSYRFALQQAATPYCFLKNTYYDLRVRWSSLSHFQSASLAQVAQTIRLTVLHSKQASVIKDNLEFQEQHPTSLVSPGPPGISLAYMPVISSWATFEYNGMDFSKALSTDDKGNAPLPQSSNAGKVVFTQPLIALPLGITVDPLALILKDGCGGYWIHANLSATQWKGHRSFTL